MVQVSYLRDMGLRPSHRRPISANVRIMHEALLLPTNHGRRLSSSSILAGHSPEWVPAARVAAFARRDEGA